MRTSPHLKRHLMLDMQQTRFQDDILIVCVSHLFHPYWPWKCIFVKYKSNITPWRSRLKHREANGCSLRKQPAFRDATSRFPAKWRMMNERPQPSMEFLRSFLRPHFAGKRVLASRNVGCFQRLLLLGLGKKKKNRDPDRYVVCLNLTDVVAS